MKGFQKDLKTISENQNIKIVLLINDTQVMFFSFYFFIVLFKDVRAMIKKALHLLFTCLVALTKMDQTAYAFLVSSEEFFYSWLMKQENFIEKIYTIGNLSKTSASTYFTKIVGVNQLNLAISFDNLFKITGSFTY